MEDTSDRIKSLIARFVLKYNYWGYLFSRIRRKASSSIPSIMGIAPESDGTLCLYYHPELVDKTDDENIIKVIEHEGMHVLNHHISRAIRILDVEQNEYLKEQKSKIFNLAADCSVNQQAKLPKTLKIADVDWGLCFPELYGLEPDKITEYYYYKLLEKQQNQNQQQQSGGKDGKKGKNANGNGNGENKADIGDHSNWRKNLEGVSDLSSLSRKLEQHTRKLIKDSVKSFSKDRGRLPGHIAQLIESALEPPKAPYYQIIRKLVRGTRRTKYLSSPTKINRKRTYAFHLTDEKIPKISPFPGKTRDFTFDIVVLLDTSGSMSTDDIKEGLSGIKNIIEKDRNCHTVVLEVDTNIEKEYVCKKIRDIQYNIKGRGGTTLGPGLKRARELGCDVCLVFTDGYIENVNEMNRKLLPKKIIWVINNGGSVSNLNKTGYIVRI